MSTETHVFFTGPLPSKRALQGAMKELGFPFTLSPATGRLEDQDGYMPMRFRRDDTGVEFDVFDGREAVEEFADLDIDPAFDRAANFRWGGDLVEAAAGQCGAAALAKLVGGVVFDEAEDRLLSIDEAAKVAQGTIAAIPAPAPKKPGARQADLKRYLKPLLELRPDLMLTGRLLIIQPVRHLLRGAWFESSSDRTCFYLNWFVQPLAGGPILHERVAPLYVDRPQFLPLFYHCLRKQVFEHVGKITTLDAYRSTRDWTRAKPSNYVAPVFVTEGIEAAKKLIAEGPVYDSPGALERFNALSEQGMEALLQHYRGKEADAAGELKIAEGWNQAPFPIEVPPDERDALTSEPAFSAELWVEFDPGWRADMPTANGEIRFAEDDWGRGGEDFLIGPILPEEARQRRAENRSYVFAKRLQDGTLGVFRRYAYERGAWENVTADDGAERKRYYQSQFFRVVLVGRRSISASFSTGSDPLENIYLSSVSVCDQRREEIWYAWVDYSGKSIGTWDHRGDSTVYKRRQVGDDELTAAKVPNPEFDECERMFDCVTAFLAENGYGRLE
jgi:hypothetical protein